MTELHTTFYELCNCCESSGGGRKKQTIIHLPLPVVFFVVSTSRDIWLLIM